ncbi:TPA: hypothetical protein U0595_001813 [Streptococcus suis]|nr:hypothetical protein [Streptococcus suis]HEM2759353.1 hypothetical protein [Streptococcus suis]HEM2766213.1 hypothetical protein [Streptococcus suis]
MKKKLLVALILTFISLLLWGIGKLYIAYNLSHYSGYYVQQLPRKEGTNPELVIILTHLDSVERPEVNGLTYNLRGNGGIIKDDSFYLFDVSDEFQLTISDEDGDYFFNHDNGEYLYYYTDNIDKKNMIHNIKKRRNYFLIKSYLLS